MAKFRRKVLVEWFEVSILGETFKIALRVMNAKDSLLWAETVNRVQRAEEDGVEGFAVKGRDIDSFVDLLIPLVEGFEGLTDDDDQCIKSEDLDEPELRELLLQLETGDLIRLGLEVAAIGRLKEVEKKA